jgi:flavin-dependent dehydrogenase
VGPGFALVGDAGNFKDFVTGQGMTDALLGAENLAKAVLDGRQEAFDVYWRERDASSLPLHFDAQRLGEVGVNDALTRLIFERLGMSPLRDRPTLVADRKISPFELLPTKTLASWVLAAVLRGRFDVLRPFLKTGKRMAEFRKEIAARHALLDEAREKLAGASPRDPTRRQTEPVAASAA